MLLDRMREGHAVGALTPAGTAPPDDGEQKTRAAHRESCYSLVAVAVLPLSGTVVPDGLRP
jgi:hypothetical protein